jgi:hypothetical protein
MEAGMGEIDEQLQKNNPDWHGWERDLGLYETSSILKVLFTYRLMNAIEIF